MGQLQHLIRCFLVLDVLRIFFWKDNSRSENNSRTSKQKAFPENQESYMMNYPFLWALNNKNVKNLYLTHFKVFTLYWMQTTVSQYLRKDHHVDTGTYMFPSSGCQKDYTLLSLLIPWDKFIKYLILKWWCLHCHPHLWLMILLWYLFIPYKNQKRKKLEEKKTKFFNSIFPVYFKTWKITNTKPTFLQWLAFYFITGLFLRSGEDTLLAQIKENPTGQNSLFIYFGLFLFSKTEFLCIALAVFELFVDQSGLQIRDVPAFASCAGIKDVHHHASSNSPI